MNNETMAQRRSAAVTPAAQSVHPIYVRRGRGSYVWDVEDRKYLDLTSGIAVMNLGHGHPRVIEAVKNQVDEFQHLCFAVAMHPTYIELAERLNQIAPGNGAKKSFLANSGAEAVENAVKIARAYTGRQGIVAFTHAFHGRTHMALSLTGKADPYKAGFAPRAAEIYRAPYPYHYRNPWGADTHEETGEKALAFLRDFVKTTVGASEVAAFLIEPVAGEGGFIPAPGNFLRGLRALADEIGALWIDDEVQAGMGRTGRMWAVDHYGLEPDLVTTAKALASGFPLSAVIGKKHIMDALDPGMLGTTYGGNPAACAAALATLDVIEGEDLLARASHIGERFTAAFRDLQSRFDGIGDVRSLGAMVGVELVGEGKEPDKKRTDAIVTAAREDGLLLLSTGTYGNVIRLLPPINLSDAEIDEGIEKLNRCFANAFERESVLA